MRLAYLYDRSLYTGTGKTAPFYWDGPLTAIAGAIILVPCHVVMSLQLLWRLGIHKWNLPVPNFQISCSDLT